MAIYGLQKAPKTINAAQKQSKSFNYDKKAPKAVRIAVN